MLQLSSLGYEETLTEGEGGSCVERDKETSRLTTGSYGELVGDVDD
jgi:hypothetical protein